MQTSRPLPAELDLAAKVWNFRRDRLNAKESSELVARTEELRRMLKDRADAAKLKLGIESLENVLSRAGGAIYPKTSLVENVEFFLVAALVILGIRTYFVQPFKIPTNSMWPSYYGMTAENLPPSSPAPNAAERAFRLLAYGAIRHTAVAPRDGEVSALLVMRTDRTRSLAYTVKNGVLTSATFPGTANHGNPGINDIYRPGAGSSTYYLDGNTTWTPTSAQTPIRG